MLLDEIHIRDPFVLVENDTCYLYGTTSGKTFLGYKSNDLIHFEGPYVLFDPDNDFWGTQDFWAPEVYKINNKFYMFASFKNESKSRATQVLISDTPLGKFKPTKRPFTPSNWECLDGTYYQEDGINYTVFVKEWVQVHDGEMYLGVLNESFNGLIGEPKLLFKATDSKWSKSWNNLDYVTDGPFIYRLKSGKLIMIWSSHGEKGYWLGSAISDNNKITGNWTQQKDLVFESNGGHGMIFSFKGEKYLSIHYPNQPYGLERAHFYKFKETDDSIIVEK